MCFFKVKLQCWVKPNLKRYIAFDSANLPPAIYSKKIEFVQRFS